MKYLVTGAAGFIGGALAQKLRHDGHDVICIDTADKSGDLLDFEDLKSKAAACDGIFHLGAIASVPKTFEDPEGSHAVNVQGTLNVFKAAKSAGNIPVVYASSAAVYGDNPALPLLETEKPRPLSPYAKQKLQNETDAKDYGAEALPTFGLRFFNVYGHGQDPSSPYSGVISIFYERLLGKKPLTVFGDGKQTRDFIAVKDAVAALRLAMEHAAPSAPVANICTGKSVTLQELIDTLGEVMDMKPEVKYEAARTGDIKNSCGNPDHFSALTGFTPQTSLHNGLMDLLGEE